MGGALLADPAADPPFGASDLEGQILLGARARVPGQDIPLGEWSPETLVPLQTRLHALAFRVFGVDLTVARAVSGGAALLSLVLLYLLLLRTGRPVVAFLATLFLAVNPVYFGVARTALPPALSILFMLAAIWIWILGERRPWMAFLAGVAVVLVGLLENGPLNAFFLVAGLLMALFLRLHAWKMGWFYRTRRRQRFFLAGVVVALGFFVLVLLQHWMAYGLTWRHFVGMTIRTVAANVLRSPLHVAQMVKLMPVVALVALVYFLFFAKDVVRPVARHRRLDEVRLWFLCWLLAGVPYIVLGSSFALYELVLLVPPICVLAAEGIVRFFSQRRLERPHLDPMIVVLLIAGTVWFVVAYLVTTRFGRLELPGYWGRHQLRASLLIAFVAWGVLTYLLGWLYLKWKRFTLPLRPVWVTAVVALLVLAAVGHEILVAASWWPRRTHQVQEASRALELLTARDLVVGSWAPLLTLGQQARGAIVWPNLNRTPRPWHEEVTYLVLQHGREQEAGIPPRLVFSRAGGGRGVTDLGQIGRIGTRRIHLFRVGPGD